MKHSVSESPGLSRSSSPKVLFMDEAVSPRFDVLTAGKPSAASSSSLWLWPQNPQRARFSSLLTISKKPFVPRRPYPSFSDANFPRTHPRGLQSLTFPHPRDRKGAHFPSELVDSIYPHPYAAGSPRTIPLRLATFGPGTPAAGEDHHAAHNPPPAAWPASWKFLRRPRWPR